MSGILETLLLEIRKPQAVFQVLVLTVAAFLVFQSVRGTRGEALLKGAIFVFFVGFVGLLSAFEALHLTQLKQGILWLLSISSLAVVVVFAPELRRALSKLTTSGLFRPVAKSVEDDTLEAIVDAALSLSRRRMGMLVTIEREMALDDLIEESAERLDAKVTKPLLETIFYRGSPLHDGAVIVRGGRIVAAACTLPSGQDVAVARRFGMRHRAAVGVTEETDAVVVVVSEETGDVSICKGGRIETVPADREAVKNRLRESLTRDTIPMGQKIVQKFKTRRLASTEEAPSAETGAGEKP